MKRIKVYVGCAIQNAPADFVERIKQIRAEIGKALGIEILEFRGHGDPVDVYNQDIRHCVQNADVMLAICDLPSLGLGYEMAVHHKHFNRPLMVVAHNDANVSSLVRGIHEEAPFTFRRYSDLSEVPQIFLGWLGKDLAPWFTFLQSD